MNLLFPPNWALFFPSGIGERLFAMAAGVAVGIAFGVVALALLVVYVSVFGS